MFANLQGSSKFNQLHYMILQLILGATPYYLVVLAAIAALAYYDLRITQAYGRGIQDAERELTFILQEAPKAYQRGLEDGKALVGPDREALLKQGNSIIDELEELNGTIHNK